MSLKEDLGAVKTEIDNEEKFLTAYVKVEKFFKRYKTVFVAVAVLAVAGFAGYEGYKYYDDTRIAAANEAYGKLLKDKNDKEALATLKSKSKPLYEAYMMREAAKSSDDKAFAALASSTNPVIASIASYETAIASKDPSKLLSYAAAQNAFYKDMAFFTAAYQFIEAKDYKKAKEALAKIDAKSELREYADFLTHSFITLQK